MRGGVKTRGTMSAEMDALTVVNQLRDLAADPLNRRAIVEDQGCLPGLILFLDHPNPQVVYSALLVSRIRLSIFYLCAFIYNSPQHRWLLLRKGKPYGLGII